MLCCGWRAQEGCTCCRWDTLGVQAAVSPLRHPAPPSRCLSRVPSPVPRRSSVQCSGVRRPHSASVTPCSPTAMVPVHGRLALAMTWPRLRDTVALCPPRAQAQVQDNPPSRPRLVLRGGEDPVVRVSCQNPQTPGAWQLQPQPGRLPSYRGPPPALIVTGNRACRGAGSRLVWGESLGPWIPALQGAGVLPQYTAGSAAGVPLWPGEGGRPCGLGISSGKAAWQGTVAEMQAQACRIPPVWSQALGQPAGTPSTPGVKGIARI